VFGLGAGMALSPAAGAADPGSPRWFSYSRPATYTAVSSKQDVLMRDGTLLACGLTRPSAPGRFPVIVNDNTPYSPAYDVKDSFWAPRGYVSITCNPRGTMSWLEANKKLPNAQRDASFSAAEQRDWYDLVEWAAKQPWSTGKVGVMGYSYGGIVAYHAAGQRPPHLTTIIAGAAFSDAYTQLAYLGGARTMDIEGWMAGLSGHPTQTATSRKHPLYDDMWRTASVATKYAAIRASKIPILDFGGWYDIYQQGEPDNYQALKKQTWLVMSGGSHLEGAECVPQGGQLAWMDHWLRGKKSAPMPPTKVTSVEKPEVGTGTFQQLTDWPPPDARSTRLWLRADGGLAPAAGPVGTKQYVVNPYDGRAKYWGTPRSDDPYPDQQGVEHSRAGWQVPPLTRDLVVAGDIRARIRASLSAADTNLVVRVLDIAPNGAAILVSTGWLKASHRLGHTRLAPIVPGAVYDFNVDVWPTHWRFVKGHSIRVSISGGDVPRIEPDAPAGTVTVREGASASYLELDVRH
ncbi:MAG: hydrolase, partial [Frankiales bacterium]|nr:hydrolase [Frankiales bacterium]